MILSDIAGYEINFCTMMLIFIFAVNGALILGWLLDWILGDPSWLPHPVVLFGKLISFGEHQLNRGTHRRMKGALLALSLVVGIYVLTYLLLNYFERLFPLSFPYLGTIAEILIVFYCLAGTTLIREVRDVFHALDRSLDDGRRQVARIVGRDTSQLSEQEVRKAALETLAENLSDGVIAPLFWYLILGAPGMLTYKMVNTLDSMIGYRTVRYRDFGCFAARMDDVANYVPARLTALLMSLAGAMTGQRSVLYTLRFVNQYGSKHASPNSGYPESALAGILDCQFGGPHYYFGEYFSKPFIGENNRILSTADMTKAVRINRMVEIMMILMIFLLRSCWYLFL